MREGKDRVKAVGGTYEVNEGVKECVREGEREERKKGGRKQI